MNKISINNLCYSDVNINNCFSTFQYWNKTKAHHTEFVDRRLSGFIYFYGSSGKFKFNGKDLEANIGDVFYLAPNVQYSVTFNRELIGLPTTILINLNISDEHGKEICLSEEIFKICEDNHEKSVLTLFQKIAELFIPPTLNTTTVKEHIYHLFTKFSQFAQSQTISQKELTIIKTGIEYLHYDGEQELSIAEISKLCHISEVYFRKLFKKYSGLSPVQFRISKKIEKAKLLLESSAYTITEISDILGFESISYFSKLFKKQVGLSPQQFVNKILEI